MLNCNKLRFNRLKQKLNNSKAFTLSETLVTMLILLMVSSIMATGIPAAKDAYDKVVVISNAEVLMSTTISALRNELGTAKNISVNDSDKSITYFNQPISAMSKIFPSTESPEGSILFQRYAESNLSGLTDEERNEAVTPLVSSEASNKNLYVTYENVEIKDAVKDKGGVSYEKRILIFKNLKVKQIVKKEGEEDKELVTRPELSIRVITK